MSAAYIDYDLPRIDQSPSMGKWLSGPIVDSKIPAIIFASA
jgi:hypothetical protein